MKKKYICIDIEASGPTPAKYSMLSFGACIVGESSKRFYRELQPINNGFVLKAIEVASLGLDALRYEPGRYISKFVDQRCDEFDPHEVLRIMKRSGMQPSVAMEDFRIWIDAEAKGCTPVLVASPTAFDAMFIHYYFDNFNIKNPFGFGGTDLASLYKGYKRNMMADVKSMFSKDLPHNALEDAVLYAEAMEKMLLDMKK